MAQLQPFDPVGAFQRGRSNALSIQGQEQKLAQAAAEAPARNQLLDMKLQGAQTAQQRAQTGFAESDEIKRSKVMSKVANAMLTADESQWPGMIEQLNPKLETFGLPPLVLENLSKDKFKQVMDVSQSFIDDPNKLTKFQQSKLDIQKDAQGIRQQEADLRSSEAKERELDRQLKRETNDIKKEELQIKLAEKKKEIEEAKREKKFQQDNNIKSIDTSIGTISRMLQGSKLESAAGVSANFPTVAGSDASDFEADLETLQSQAFLGEIGKMKGMGALSENEGKKLAQAIGALTINQSDKKLRLELERIRKVMETAKKSLVSKYGPERRTQQPAEEIEVIEGATYHNPTTGEKITLVNGEWEVVQ